MAPDDHDADTSESPVAPDPGGLPRRESVSLRGENGLRSRPEESERSPEEESASRHSFADDLDAFSLGTQDSAGKGSSSS